MKISKIKLGLGLLVASATSAIAGHTVVPPNEKYKINTSDMTWQYDFQQKKCVQPDFSDRQVIVNAIRAENAQITEKFMNAAGTTYQINYMYKGDEYRIMVMDKFGECRFYQDLMIKDMNVEDTQYVGLTPAKTKN